MRVAVFGSSSVQPAEPIYVEAMSLGAALAAQGHVVLTGGYHGLMEAVSRGASDAGGHVVGITSPRLFPQRTGPNGWVAEAIVADTLAGRIAELVDRADLAVALPGSLGTFAELVTALNGAHLDGLRGATPMPLLAIGEQWAEWLDSMAEAFGFDGSLVSRVGTVDEAIAWLAAPP